MNLPDPFVDAATRHYEYVPKRYSVTSLLKSTRSVILERKHSEQIVVDVADRVWAIFGQGVHNILEQAQEGDNQLKEGHLEVGVGEYTLSGYFDLYDIDTGTVTDYKTASVWKVLFGDFDDWKKQTLIYAWMLRQKGYDARRGEIVAILRDHNLRDARFKEDYPKHPVYIISWDFTEHDFALVEAFIYSKFEEIAKAEEQPDNLPECTPQERWSKPERWAVIKPGAKKARKVFDNPTQAQALANELGYEVEYRPGEDTRCMSYCGAAPFCNQYKGA